MVKIDHCAIFQYAERHKFSLTYPMPCLTEDSGHVQSSHFENFMVDNWSEQLKQITGPPETVVDAVDRLMVILNNEQKLFIATIPEDELGNLHLSLGKAIRKAFALHDRNSKLMVDCDASHPEEAIGTIIKELWNKLTKE